MMFDDDDLEVTAGEYTRHPDRPRGGQHVPSFEQCVRVYSRELGIGVTVASERSQHKCKAEALRLLRVIAEERTRGEVKRAEWTATKMPSLTVGALRVVVWKNDASRWWPASTDDLWNWMAPGIANSETQFTSEAEAKADAVRWLRRTIAEMAAACPEVE